MLSNDSALSSGTSLLPCPPSPRDQKTTPQNLRDSFSRINSLSRGDVPPRFRLINGNDELESLPPMQWRVKNLLPMQGLAAIFGASKSGKTFLVLDLLCSIAEGREWFGYRTQQTAVVYVGLEGQEGLKSRIKAWKIHHGRNTPENLQIVMQDPFQLTDGQDIEALARVLPQHCVVVIDTLHCAAPSIDENSSRDMGRIIQNARSLQQRCNGLVILVTHTGKDEYRGIRGHSGLLATLDCAIWVQEKKGRRGWISHKVKDGQDGKKHPLRLKTIDLGSDSDGEPITSCVVEEDDREIVVEKRISGRSKLLTEGQITEGQRQAMESYRQAAEKDSVCNSDGQFIGVKESSWRKISYEMTSSKNRNTQKKQFQRSRADLLKRGWLEERLSEDRHDKVYFISKENLESLLGCESSQQAA